MLSFINIEVNNLRKTPVLQLKRYTCLTNKSCVTRTCWDTPATDSPMKSSQKDTEASINTRRDQETSKFRHQKWSFDNFKYMRSNKEPFILREDHGNANVLKYHFRTFCNLMTSYGLTKYGRKISFLNFPFSVAR